MSKESVGWVDLFMLFLDGMEKLEARVKSLEKACAVELLTSVLPLSEEEAERLEGRKREE